MPSYADGRNPSISPWAIADHGLTPATLPCRTSVAAQSGNLGITVRLTILLFIFFNFTMPWPREFNEQEAGLSMCEELRRRVVYTGVGRPQRDRPCRVLQEHGPGIAGLVNGPSCTAQDVLHAKCLTCRSCAVCISGRALRGWALWVHNVGWKHKSINAGGLGRRA